MTTTAPPTDPHDITRLLLDLQGVHPRARDTLYTTYLRGGLGAPLPGPEAFALYRKLLEAEHSCLHAENLAPTLDRAQVKACWQGGIPPIKAASLLRALRHQRFLRGTVVCQLNGHALQHGVQTAPVKSTLTDDNGRTMHVELRDLSRVFRPEALLPESLVTLYDLTFSDVFTQDRAPARLKGEHLRWTWAFRTENDVRYVSAEYLERCHEERTPRQLHQAYPWRSNGQYIRWLPVEELGGEEWMYLPVEAVAQQLRAGKVHLDALLHDLGERP
jgi:hypothetical protein